MNNIPMSKIVLLPLYVPFLMTRASPYIIPTITNVMSKRCNDSSHVLILFNTINFIHFNNVLVNANIFIKKM